MTRGSAAPSGPAAREAGVPHGFRDDRAASAKGSHRRLHFGWLAACLGLVAAATALGRPDKTRKLASRGRTRMSAFLRPAERRG
jgi:hypothetical protein